jgi:hypothetical protein
VNIRSTIQNYEEEDERVVRNVYDPYGTPQDTIFLSSQYIFLPNLPSSVLITVVPPLFVFWGFSSVGMKIIFKLKLIIHPLVYIQQFLLL